MKKSIFLLIILFVFAFIINAQNDTMYVMKNGLVVGKYNVNTEVDSVIFYKPTIVDTLIARKPNIYIYPTETIQLSVKLSFPLGGKILKSIPDYNTGWNVTVDPNGKIDNEYTHLYYESSQSDVWQKKAGWHVTQAELTQFFTSNMDSYGFNEQEIKDFIDYWIPIFKEKEYYTIYPQTNVDIEKAISIDFSNSPEKIMRLFYLVKGFDNKPVIELEEPIIPTFERTGFHVTEWGVLL